MMLRTPRKVRVPIYNGNMLHLAVGWTSTELIAYLSRRGAPASTMDFIETAEAAVVFDGPDVIIWIPRPYRIGHIVHESIHAGIRILASHGVRVDDNDEPVAYMCQWIAEEIHKEVKRQRRREI